MLLTEQAQCALSILYGRARKSGDAFELERLDRALDEIIRHNSPAPAPFQVRSALSHAGAALRRRRELAPTTTLGALAPHQEPGCQELHYAAIELLDWLRTTPELSAEQRTLLQNLIEDQDVPNLAADYNLSLPRMRERIARLRKRARTAHAQAVRA